MKKRIIWKKQGRLAVALTDLYRYQSLPRIPAFLRAEFEDAFPEILKWTHHKKYPLT